MIWIRDDEHWVAIQLFKSKNGIEKFWKKKLTHQFNDGLEFKGAKAVHTLDISAT